MSGGDILSAYFPDVDVPSFLLDAVPDLDTSCENHLYTKPFLFSAERPLSKNLSLVELKHLVKCFAAGLQKHGLQDGDHVMIVSPNYVYAIVIALGTIAAGGIFCAAQPDLRVREYVDQIRRDEPKFLFVCNEQPLRNFVNDAWKITTGSGDRCWLFDECLTGDERISERSGIIHDGPFWTEVLDLEHGPGFQWKRLTTETQCMTPCMLFTTSGTSGLRKAAMYSHRNLVASWSAIGHRVRQDIATCIRLGKVESFGKPPRRLLHTVSISRALGTTLPLAVSKSRGLLDMELYFMSKAYNDMSPYLEHIQNLRITEISCAPFTLSRLFVQGKETRSLQDHRYHFSHLRSVTSVGAPGSQSTLNRARDFLLLNGAPVTLRVERALGITEACSLVASWHHADPPCYLESCQGRIEPNMQVRVIPYDREDDDQTLQDAEGNGWGEIWLKGPSVIVGYYKNEEATREAFTKDGWFKTGDVGYIENEKLFLLDRKKDILKTPDNIPPAYIEGVLMEHDSVSDVGVVGIYDPALELQKVRAYIVRMPGSSVSENDICEWMKRESADSAHLTGGVEFMDELPRNSSGKLLRRVLRERARITFDRLHLTDLNLANGIPAFVKHN